MAYVPIIDGLRTPAEDMQWKQRLRRLEGAGDTDGLRTPAEDMQWK